MAVTWVIEGTSTVNAEGNVLTFSVKVTADNDEFTNANTPSSDDMVVVKANVGTVQGWRYNLKTGTMANPGPANIRGFFISDMQAPVDEGGDWVIRFKLGVRLTTLGHVAINNAPSATKVNGLTAGWTTLKWIPPHVPPDVPPGVWIAPAIAAADLICNNSAVGKLPDSFASSLKLSVDAQAQWVTEGGAETNLATWNDLRALDNLSGAGAGGDKPDLAADALGRSVMTLDGDVRFVTDGTPPALTSAATVAAVFRPTSGSSTPSTVVGRWNLPSNASWRVYYLDATDRRVVYESKSITPSSDAFVLAEEDDTVFVIVRRQAVLNGNTEVWINGRPYPVVTAVYPVVAGGDVLSVGADQTSAGVWGDAFTGDISQVALYSTNISDLMLSLVMHQMAMRAVIDLGTPIPEAFQTQPYGASAGQRRLDRRPIAVIGLFSGNFDPVDGAPNPFGQQKTWNYGTQAEIEKYFRDTIYDILNANDRFEIMFNRPGGQYQDDIVPSFVFGTDPAMVTTTQWNALFATWDDFNLSHYNDDSALLGRLPRRRAWFYTGGGLPLNSDGTLDTSGRMGVRVVGPATSDCYLSAILEEWTNRDDRFRCLFMDAAIHFYGQQVALVQDAAVNTEYTLVGEAVPQSGLADDEPLFPSEYAARRGAPWFGLCGFPTGPWWNVSAADENQTRIDAGYNINWISDWTEMPVYFGVQDNGFLDLHRTQSPQTPSLPGDNLTIGWIYQWILKGAVPVAWSAGVLRRVGAAFDYAQGRTDVSRFASSARVLRIARF